MSTKGNRRSFACRVLPLAQWAAALMVASSVLAMGAPAPVGDGPAACPAGTVGAFRAEVVGGRTVLVWETDGESGTIGFYLWRRGPAGGPYTRVNDDMVLGLLVSPQGGTYRVADPGALPGETCSYRLVEVDARGRERSYGPFRVRVPTDAEGAIPARDRMELDAAGCARSPHPLSLPAGGPAREPGNPERRQAVARAMLMEPVRGALDLAGIATGARRVSRAAPAWTLKVATTEEGLHYLSAADIAAAVGVDVAVVEGLVASNGLRLCWRQTNIPLLAEDGNTGIFFYGEKIESHYTTRNVYRLTPERGRRMATSRTFVTAPATGLETFPENLHFEQEVYASPALFTDPKADFWQWDYVISGHATLGRKSFTLSLPGMDTATPAVLSVSLLGSSTTAVNPDHHARIYVNAVYAGQVWFDDASECTVQIALPGGLLVDGNNTVMVEGVLDTGAPYSVFYIDSLDVGYARYYRAVNDSLTCLGGGNPVVTVSGFTDPGIALLDVSRAKNPRLVVGAVVDYGVGQSDPDAPPALGAGESYRITFRPKGSANAGRYLALTASALKSPSLLTLDVPSALRLRQNRGAYLVITSSTLQATAQTLADYRATQGFETTVVDVEDIYDEFNYGIMDPDAIRRFLAVAARAWSWPPRYVLIAGDGTYDYRNIAGIGDNLVPPLMIGTEFGLYAADRAYTTRQAIGRIPAATPAELQAVIDKIVAYEAGGGAWTKKALFTADNPDSGGDFEADADMLAALMPADFTATKIFLDAQPVAVVRGQVIAALNAGTAIFCFSGHGGLNKFTDEGMFRATDVPGLTNGACLPIVAALTCMGGRYDVPGYKCMGETLVMRAGRGAVASFGASGMTYDTDNCRLGRFFLCDLTNPRKGVLGDAMLRAFRSYRRVPPTAGTYGLLGDPAMPIQRD